jgi:hypothetical protein
MAQRDNISFKRFWPGIIWFIVLMVLICTPGKHLPKSKFLAEIFFDKLVHVGCFALLVWLFYYPFAKSSLPITAKSNYLIKICLSAITLYGAGVLTYMTGWPIRWGRYWPLLRLNGGRQRPKAERLLYFRLF